MKKVYLFVFLACTSATFTSCGADLADDLIGTWNAISWTIEGNEKSNTDSVQFIFNADKTYEAKFGIESEQGTYRVFGRNLYTTAEGKLEKLVKFDFDEDLNLVFAMNRVGTAEKIVLKKEVRK